jgi:hypothetical protein
MYSSVRAYPCARQSISLRMDERLDTLQREGIIL